MKIQYYAWMKDEVGIAEEELDLPAEIVTVGQLINWLSGRSPRHHKAFEFIEAIKVVINRENAGNDYPVKNDDEVIFMPPVAGGL
jgi:molybdopterin synthase sulfur carrier subunit